MNELDKSVVETAVMEIAYTTEEIRRTVQIEQVESRDEGECAFLALGGKVLPSTQGEDRKESK